MGVIMKDIPQLLLSSALPCSSASGGFLYSLPIFKFVRKRKSILALICLKTRT